MNTTQYTNFIKQQSQLLGFNYCCIAKAQFLNEDAKRLEQWLNKGMHGTMQYMEDYFDLRVDPTKLVPNAKSVITLLLNYFPTQQQNTAAPKISKYAYGNDYHGVIRNKLKELLLLLKQEVGEINGRGFVDSAPVLERSWAQKSGLGWIGKNGNLINKQSGSYFFIATLIVDLPLEYDNALVKDFCGTCTKCIDSCPTNAILPNKVVDGSKCISYYTIELKDGLLPDGLQGKFDNWMFGCDVCQDVCPWNRFSSPTKEINFTPIPQILNFTTNDWEELTEESFRTIFKNSAIKRTKFSGIKRNLSFIKNNHEA
ncbi:MAG: tRNA epoxyqueuosine(34) reductase QueG [Ferruginibacter sp.]|nr:tRNA epoxyqueuosine(34) reductase QueG [Ferruginibacter sp.]